MIEKIACELMSTDQQSSLFEATMEMNLSFGVPAISATSASTLFRQRGSISASSSATSSATFPSSMSLELPPVLSELIMEKRGLILIVGATGSGKSTTIASMLDHRNAHRSAGHILTARGSDRVHSSGTRSRSSTSARSGMDTRGWRVALKNAMRQAPDCILIGEIRDKETMQACHRLRADRPPLLRRRCTPTTATHALNRIISFFPLDNASRLAVSSTCRPV
jgi:twitching motility protein PilU